METHDYSDLSGYHTQAIPPTILDGFIQPGFPFAKVFTCFFLDRFLVFTKTGSFGTHTAGTLRGSLGGYTPEAMVAGAIGSFVDSQSSQVRAAKAGQLAAFSPEEMLLAHKRNFLLAYDSIESVEIRGPNFVRELRITLIAANRHKFRLDHQSKESAKYIESVFNKFIPGKVVRS